MRLSIVNLLLLTNVTPARDAQALIFVEFFLCRILVADGKAGGVVAIGS
jgi:hypothetical protein